MRELKFKAWNEYGQRWLRSGEFFINPVDGEPYFYDDNIDEEEACWKPASFFVPKEDIIICQYTGLKDKNGKEGYQGDWLEGLFDDCYIDWCDKCCQFQLFTTEFGCIRCQGDVDWWEVVDSVRSGESWFGSNIYEDKYLVEK